MSTVDRYAATRAAHLLKAYRRPLAKAVALQIKQMVASYTPVDRGALERNLGLLIDAAEAVLERDDSGPMMDVLQTIISIRQASGVSLSDFALASMGTFPVVRRFFTQRASDCAQGLRYYEAFEARMMPVVARIIDTFLRLQDSNATIPDGFMSVSTLTSLFEQTEPFYIVPVESGDAEP